MMIFLVGLILLGGYSAGYLAVKLGVPKVTGYFLMGLLLSPEINSFVASDFPSITEPITDLCLAFITFEVGCTLSMEKLKAHGKAIIAVSSLEALGAFLIVLIGFLFLSPIFIDMAGYDILGLSIPFSILIASLAAPTDPSATLAVMHQYKARGIVSETIMGAAALDDAFTLLLFSLSFAVATSFIGKTATPILEVIYKTATIIIGALMIGILLGWIFNKLTNALEIREEGQIIVLVLGFLAAAFGASVLLGFDELFSTLTFGIIVTNFNGNKDKVIGLTERYTEELVFIFFFVLGAMHLKWKSLGEAGGLILLFILLRLAGKYLGTFLGAKISKMPSSVSKYAFAGLIPQGGIVLGLALVIQKDPNFSVISDLLIGTIMGATLIHEFIGPLTSKWAIKRAREVRE